MAGSPIWANQDATVDVIIPALNAEQFIAQTLVSILAQTHTPQSIIVVDDGSTDGTCDIVRRYAGKAADVQVILIASSGSGVSAARNTGAAAATAEILAFCDADDTWSPSKLEEQVRVFRTHDDEGRALGLVYCDYELIDDQGALQPCLPRQRPAVRGYCPEGLRAGNRITGSASAAVVPKRCFVQVGGFDETLTCAEDWDLWMRIGSQFCVEFVSASLVQVRVHPSNSQRNRVSMFVGRARFVQKHLAMRDISKSVWFTVLADMRSWPGDAAAAAPSLPSGFRFSPPARLIIGELARQFYRWRGAARARLITGPTRA